jgi:hypothetical protein
MKRWLFGFVAVAVLMLGASTASAHDFGHGCYGGYSSFYPSYGYGCYQPTWHNTSHLHYHPGYFAPHGNHLHYVPGHYDLHSTGHWHW